MVMEAKTPHNPQSARWRTRKLLVPFSLSPKVWELAGGVSSGLESKRPRTRDTSVWGQRRWESQFKKRDFICPPSTFLLFWSLKQTKWCLLTLGKTVYFTQFNSSKANFFWKQPYIDIPRNNVLPPILASLCTVKLTHKISHHKSTPCQLGICMHLLKSCLIPKQKQDHNFT